MDLGGIAYMGDDINDLPALALAGLSVAPANAHAAVKKLVHLVTLNSGGNGAVREVIDKILEGRSLPAP
jgi:3-deoxy-D-manno-octulosonate 8-phosphate phosphatase (KDO 8-P phosphatase)